MNDGSPLTWTNWGRNEPNDHGNGEDLVHMILTDGNSYDGNRNGEWNDITSKNRADEPDRIAYSQNNAFICVKDPQDI